MAERILVIGGTGRTGQQIVHKALQQGYLVRVLTRHPDRQSNKETVEYVVGDITDSERVAAALDDVHGIVIIVESSDSDAAPNSPQRVHFDGTRHVVDAIAGRPIQLVLVTQIYITRPERYPEVRNIIHWRREAEAVVRASGIPYTILRPAWLTDERGGRQAVRLEQGDTGDGKVTRADMAEACVQALRNHAARGKTFEVYTVAGEPPADWARLFSQLHGDRNTASER